MTGHLVLATLHTNDAIGVVQRLVDLGLDRASISASLRGALGQRLIRKLCDNCAAPQPADRDENTARLEKLFGTRQVRRPVGCKVCGDSGYFGRIPLIEVLVSNTELQEKIARGSTTAEMQRTAERGGMRALREVSLEYVVSGATTLQEVERVLGEGEGSYSSNAVPEVETQRVLVVDDDPLMRELAVNILRDNGFETEQAIDGQAAIDFLMRDANFSLVTLDLSMPNADGRDVLRHMRSSVPTATLPAIVLTGSDSEASEVELMNEGADDYLHKPLDPARFIARVRAVLRRAGA
jgi:CheY-like chemotaxis protein